MDRFLQCLLDREFEALILDGSQVPEEELLQAWANIYVEYNDLLGDDTHNLLTEGVKKVNKISSTILLARAILSYLKQQHSDDLIIMLNKIGLTVTLDSSNEKAYANGLRLIEIRIKKLMVDLEDAHAEIAKLQGNQVEEMKAEDFFDDWFDAISAYQRFFVKPSDITVSRFCKLINKIKRASERKALEHGNQTY